MIRFLKNRVYLHLTFTIIIINFINNMSQYKYIYVINLTCVKRFASLVELYSEHMVVV